MKKSKKVLVLLLAAVMCFPLTATLSGCGKKGNDDTKFTIWAAAADRRFVEEQAEAYIDMMGWDMTVNVVAVEEDQVEGKLMDAPKDAADIMSAPADKIESFAKARFISRLGSGAVNAITSASSEDRSTVKSLEGAQATVDGEQGYYAFPYTVETYFMYYDTKTFTSTDIQLLDNILPATGTNTSGKNIAIPFNVGFYSASVFMSNGAKFIKSDGTSLDRIQYYNGSTELAGAANDAEAVKALDAIKRYSTATNFTWPQDGDEDIVNKVQNKAIYAGVSGVWAYKNLQAAFTQAGMTMGIAPLPNIKIGGTTTSWKSFENYKYYVISSTNGMSASKADKCIMLANYLSGNEVQALRFLTNGNIPTNVSLQTAFSANNFEIGTPDEYKTIYNVTMAQIAKGGLINNPPSALWTGLQLITKAKLDSTSTTALWTEIVDAMRPAV